MILGKEDNFFPNQFAKNADKKNKNERSDLKMPGYQEL